MVNQRVMLVFGPGTPVSGIGHARIHKPIAPRDLRRFSAKQASVSCHGSDYTFLRDDTFSGLPRKSVSHQGPLSKCSRNPRVPQHLYLNCDTSVCRSHAIRDNSSAAALALLAPSVVLRAACATPLTFCAISVEPLAASVTLRLISPV